MNNKVIEQVAIIPTVAIVSLLLLAGCAALPTPVVLQGDAPSFDGMSALVEGAPGRPLHVLLVHGMGTPQPYGFDAFIGALAGRFGYVQHPPSKPEGQYQGCYKRVTPAQPALVTPPPDVIDVPAAAPENQARLYTYDFGPPGSDRTALTVSYLLWTPLTEAVKCRLEDEDASAPQKQAFADFAKDFIDDKLADAVLYSGSYRQRVLRLSLQGALCKVTGGKWTAGECAPHGPDYRDPTVIITHSLGGYMIMDAIQSDLRCKLGPNAAVARTPAEKVLENTPVIYMMANQLALLDLSTLQHDPNAPRVRASESPGEKITNDFAECWAEARAMAARRERAERPGQPGRRIQRSQRHSLVAAPAPEPSVSARRLGQGRRHQRLHVEQRVQHPGRDLGPGERPYRLFRQSDSHQYADLRRGKRRATTMSAKRLTLIDKVTMERAATACPLSQSSKIIAAEPPRPPRLSPLLLLPLHIGNVALDVLRRLRIGVA